MIFYSQMATTRPSVDWLDRPIAEKDVEEVSLIYFISCSCTYRMNEYIFLPRIHILRYYEAAVITNYTGSTASVVHLPTDLLQELLIVV